MLQNKPILQVNISQKINYLEHANLYLYNWKFCGGPSLEENGSSEAKDDPLPPKPDRGID